MVSTRAAGPSVVMIESRHGRGRIDPHFRVRDEGRNRATDIRETVCRVSLTFAAVIKGMHDSDSASIQEPFGISVRRPFGRSSRCCGLPPPEA
jgi:hypothetical protein